MRNLGIPTVVDRVIQQAIVQVLSPIYEKQFSESSYGFRPKRSCEMAIIRSLEVMNDGYDWIVDLDLEKFFDTVNQDKLIGLIMKTVKDGDVVSLIRKFLVSGVMENGHYEPTKVGTPQGGNSSPLLSNIMLNELDKELEARGLKFVRINYAVRGWVNYFRIANMKKVLAKIDERLRTRIRVIIWKQWKKTKTRRDALVKLGMPIELAFHCANTRKGYQ